MLDNLLYHVLPSLAVKMKEYRERTTAEIQHRAQLVSDLKQELGQADDLAVRGLQLLCGMELRYVRKCRDWETFTSLVFMHSVCGFGRQTA